MKVTVEELTLTFSITGMLFGGYYLKFFKKDSNKKIPLTALQREISFIHHVNKDALGGPGLALYESTAVMKVLV